MARAAPSAAAKRITASRDETPAQAAAAPREERPRGASAARAAPKAAAEPAAPAPYEDSDGEGIAASPPMCRVETKRVEQLAAELDTWLATPSEDCQKPRGLRDTICELSGRICRIADRHPLDDPARSRCQDARAACDRAQRILRERCGG